MFDVDDVSGREGRPPMGTREGLGAAALAAVMAASPANAGVISSYSSDIFADNNDDYSITLITGQAVSSTVQWLGHDYLPYNDYGYVTINGPTGTHSVITA